jgi:predicted DNA repair protein MutK
MASGFFALFDDIAYLMDDVAAASKVAAKKTAGILGDDLAVNANKASGYASSRELPVLWAITKGSFLNKLIILPLIFLLSYYASFLITPILMIGGVYLAYEGVEKIAEYLFHHDKGHSKETKGLSEKEKIKSAIVTDFILSIEIVIIALSSVTNEPFMTQVISVTITAFLATIGVYGIVALIVRMDDIGLYLIEKFDGFLEIIGKGLVLALPKVIKSLSVIGTFAMLLVAGGIYLHNIHELYDYLHFLPSLLAELVVGLVIGSVAVGVMKLFHKS